MSVLRPSLSCFKTWQPCALVVFGGGGRAIPIYSPTPQGFSDLFFSNEEIPCDLSKERHEVKKDISQSFGLLDLSRFSFFSFSRFIYLPAIFLFPFFLFPFSFFL